MKKTLLALGLVLQASFLFAATDYRVLTNLNDNDRFNITRPGLTELRYIEFTNLQALMTNGGGGGVTPAQLNALGANMTNFTTNFVATATNAVTLATGAAATNFTTNFVMTATNTVTLATGAAATNFTTNFIATATNDVLLAAGKAATNFTTNFVMTATNSVLLQAGISATNFTTNFVATATNTILQTAGAAATNALTNYTGFLPIGGGTVTGAVYSTASSASNSPAINEFPVAGWVRSLFASGLQFWVTTNVDAVAKSGFGGGTNVYEFRGAIPVRDSRNYTNPAVNEYIGSVITTNTFSELSGPVTMDTYLNLAGVGGSLTVHHEIYYTYDKTNLLGDFESGSQTISSTSTNLYQFVVSFPTIFSTNDTGFYVVRRLKVTAKVATPTLVVSLGTNTPSHINLSGPNSAFGNAYLANNQTFTGTNTFTKPIIGDASLLTNFPTLTNYVTWPTTNSYLNTNQLKAGADISLTWIGSDLYINYGSGGGGGGTLGSNLLYHWRMDETSGTRVDATNNEILYEVGTPGYDTGKLTNAATFGYGNALSSTNNVFETGTSPFTVAGWYYFNNINDSERMVAKRMDGGADDYNTSFVVDLTGLGAQIEYGIYYNGSQTFVYSPAVIVPNQWFLIIFEFEPSAAIRISVHPDFAAFGIDATNSSEAVTALDQVNQVNNPLAIGGYVDDDSYHMDGRIDSISFWNRLLSASEKEDLFNSGAGFDYPFYSAPPPVSGYVTTNGVNGIVTNNYLSLANTNAFANGIATAAALAAGGASTNFTTNFVQGVVTNYVLKTDGVATNLYLTNASSPGAGVNSIKFGNSTKAQEQDAIALGSSADARGYRSVVLGALGQTHTTNAIAIGTFARATNTDAVALGASTRAYYIDSTAVGTGAETTNHGHIALGTDTNFVSGGTFESRAAGGFYGNGANLTNLYDAGKWATNFTTNFVLTATNTVTLVVGAASTNFTTNFVQSLTNVYVTELDGYATNLYLTNASSPGSGVSSQQFLPGAAAPGRVATALGANSLAGGTNCLAVGISAQATDQDTTAVGNNAVASKIYGTAVGSGAQAQTNSTAVGSGAVASGVSSMALGSGSQATGNGSIAINANAAYHDSVGIMSDSTNHGHFALGNETNFVSSGTFEAKATGGFYGSGANLSNLYSAGLLATNYTDLGVNSVSNMVVTASNYLAALAIPFDPASDTNLWVREDFLANVNTNWPNVNTFAGASTMSVKVADNLPVGDFNHPGVMNQGVCVAVTGTNQPYVTWTPAYTCFTNHDMVFWSQVRFPLTIDANSTNHMMWMGGIGDVGAWNTSTNMITNGVYFWYDSLVGGNHLINVTMRQSAGGITNYNDGVTTLTSNTWYCFKITVNKENTQIKTYINETLFYTFTNCLVLNGTNGVTGFNYLAKKRGRWGRTNLVDFMGFRAEQMVR